jgi:hypothetical protein
MSAANTARISSDRIGRPREAAEAVPARGFAALRPPSILELSALPRLGVGTLCLDGPAAEDIVADDGAGGARLAAATRGRRPPANDDDGTAVAGRDDTTDEDLIVGWVFSLEPTTLPVAGRTDLVLIMLVFSAFSLSAGAEGARARDEAARAEKRDMAARRR